MGTTFITHKEPYNFARLVALKDDALSRVATRREQHVARFRLHLNGWIIRTLCENFITNSSKHVKSRFSAIGARKLVYLSF